MSVYVYIQKNSTTCCSSKRVGVCTFLWSWNHIHFLELVMEFRTFCSVGFFVHAVKIKNVTFSRRQREHRRLNVNKLLRFIREFGLVYNIRIHTSRGTPGTKFKGISLRVRSIKKCSYTLRRTRCYILLYYIYIGTVRNRHNMYNNMICIYNILSNII